VTDYDVDEVVKRMVRRELMWYRHYWGTVLSTADSLGVGRVQVQIPELRWNDQRSAKWCSPRYNPGLSVPPVDSYVEVYFVEGSPKRPVWIGRVPEIGEILKNYTGPTTEVLWEDKTSGVGLVYNAATGMLSVANGGGGTLQSDVTTDPVSWPILTMLAAMWGLTLTSFQAVFGKT